LISNIFWVRKYKDKYFLNLLPEISGSVICSVYNSGDISTINIVMNETCGKYL